MAELDLRQRNMRIVYNDTGFKYYLFAHAEKEEDFTEYAKQCKFLTLYDTEVSAEYGDKLLTLSTCEYSRNNGRLVVVAKRIVEGQQIFSIPKGGQAMGKEIKTRHIHTEKGYFFIEEYYPWDLMALWGRRASG